MLKIKDLVHQCKIHLMKCARKKYFTVKIVHWDRRKCPSYGGVRLIVVLLVEVFLQGLDLHSAGTRQSVRLRKVSILSGFTVYSSLKIT